MDTLTPLRRRDYTGVLIAELREIAADGAIVWQEINRRVTHVTLGEHHAGYGGYSSMCDVIPGESFDAMYAEALARIAS